MKEIMPPSPQFPAPSPRASTGAALLAASPRLCRPGTINLRSSAFICGLVCAEAPTSNGFDRINRMDRIYPSVNPVNPVHPVKSGSSFSAAPDINYSEFIKICTSQNTSSRSFHIFIHNTFIGPGNTLYTDRIKSSCVRGNAYKNPEGKLWYPV